MAGRRYGEGNHFISKGGGTWGLTPFTQENLKWRLDGKNFFATEAKQVFGRPQDLPPELETQLVQHILEPEKIFLVGREDVKKLAFEIAEANSIPSRFNKESKMACQNVCLQ